MAAAALVSVVAVNDLGTPFGTLPERFDICTAQEVVDAAPATAITIPQLWELIKSLTYNLNGVVGQQAYTAFSLAECVRFVNSRKDGSGDFYCRHNLGVLMLGFSVFSCAYDIALFED